MRKPSLAQTIEEQTTRLIRTISQVLRNHTDTVSISTGSSHEGAVIKTIRFFRDNGWTVERDTEDGDKVLRFSR